MTAILRETPASVRAQIADIGVELERVIERCLEKKAEQRFHSASDLGFTLKSILADSGSVQPAKDTGRLWGFAIPVATAAIVLFAVGGWLLTRSWMVTRNAQATQGEIRSIAVLPFDNLANDPAQQVYVDAIWESITDDLAKISAIQVTSSHTLRYYREKNMPMSEMEAKLGVDAFVTGSALHSGSRVDVGVRLIRAKDGRQLWSNHYEFDKRDILPEQRKVARAVADEIKIQLSPTEQELLAAAPPRIVPVAYDAYVRGMEMLRLQTFESCNEALILFDQALTEDPAFALAHVGRARAYYRLSHEFLAPKDAMPKSRQAALQALAIDDSLADAHVVLGLYALQYEWDWDGARDAFTKALQLSPNSAKAHLGYALYLSAMDRPAEAMQHLNIVHELDRASLYTDFDHGAVSFMARDYARTIRDNKAALAIDKNWWAAHTWLAEAYSLLGEHDEAIAHALEAQRLNSTPGNRAMMGGVFAVAGRRDEAKAIYVELKAKEARNEYICPYELATIPLGLGDFDTTFTEMDRACEARADCLAWVQVDPRLDPLRDDPRFDRLLERVGFEPRHGGLHVVDDDAAAAMPDAGRLMLAVLPFANLSDDPEQEYFSDGMTEEMITTLGRLSPGKLGVIARTSSMRFKGATRGIDEIGLELGVGYVVEGSIRRAADRVRITAKLIQVSDQTQLWSDGYERDLADVFKIQVEVAEAIAAALTVELLPDQQTVQGKPPTKSSAAYDAYLLGRSYWAQRTPASLYTAIEHFTRAVELDPTYALAYSGLADAWGVLPYYVPGPYNDMMAEMAKAAEIAMALDDSLAETNVSMALLLDSTGHRKAAIEHYRKAVAIDPNNATAHQWYGCMLALEGQYDMATEEFEKTISLDPLSAVMRNDYCESMLQARRFDTAIEQCVRALELQPELFNASADLMWAYIGKGNHDAAAPAFERYLQIVNQPVEAVSLFRSTFEASGLRAGLAQWLDSLNSTQAVPGFGPAHRSACYAWCGQHDQALAWLARAVEQQDPGTETLASHLAFDGLRDDPHYRELLERRHGMIEKQERAQP